MPLAFPGCPKCGEKDLTKFGKNASKRYGVQVYCRECQSQIQRLSRTLVTPEEFEAAKKAQNGRCLLCDKVRKLHADHDHVTGKFRGLLCFVCNTKLGWVELHPDWLERVKEYLSRA